MQLTPVWQQAGLSHAHPPTWKCSGADKLWNANPAAAIEPIFSTALSSSSNFMLDALDVESERNLCCRPNSMGSIHLLKGLYKILIAIHTQRTHLKLSKASTTVQNLKNLMSQRRVQKFTKNVSI
jgi:hypothetical protein